LVVITTLHTQPLLVNVCGAQMLVQGVLVPAGYGGPLLEGMPLRGVPGSCL
jgi:hypothetical protein